jgi:hypothetical protein
MGHSKLKQIRPQRQLNQKFQTQTYKRLVELPSSRVTESDDDTFQVHLEFDASLIALPVLGCFLILLKLAGVLSMLSWIVVTIPLWMPALLLFLWVIILCGIAYGKSKR